jgi:hypothetical protein
VPVGSEDGQEKRCAKGGTRRPEAGAYASAGCRCRRMRDPSSVSEIELWTSFSPSSAQDLGRTEVDQDEGAEAIPTGPL